MRVPASLLPILHSVAVVVVMISSTRCGVVVVLVTVVRLQGRNKAPKKAARTIGGSKGYLGKAVTVSTFQRWQCYEVYKRQ